MKRFSGKPELTVEPKEGLFSCTVGCYIANTMIPKRFRAATRFPAAKHDSIKTFGMQWRQR